MARKHEAARLLKEGNSPSMISRKMAVCVGTVMGYLYNQVGEGRIRRSDIVFSIDRSVRAQIESCLAKNGNLGWTRVYACVRRSGVQADEDDVRVYMELRDARIALGDMYELVRDIELGLHGLVKKELSRVYGPAEWWRQGIPEQIRVECVAAREKDPEPADDPFCYTNLIHLKDILEKRWHVFSEVLPPKLAVDRKSLFSSLVRLNRIRNLVMHPVKGRNPTEDDFCFVREFRAHFAHLLPEEAETSRKEFVTVEDLEVL